jgi:hypothetical protein
VGFFLHGFSVFLRPVWRQSLNASEQDSENRQEHWLFSCCRVDRHGIWCIVYAVTENDGETKTTTVEGDMMMNNATVLVKKANDAVKAWEAEIGLKSTNRMLKNVIDNSIRYYDREKDGEKIVNHILNRIVEVMSR